MSMNNVVVRHMPHLEKLFITLTHGKQVKTFQRPADEKLESFIHRITSAFKGTIKTVTVVNKNQQLPYKDVTISDAFLSPCTIIIDSVPHQILLSPPTIRELKIPSDCSKIGLFVQPSLSLLDLDINNVTFKWEAKHRNDTDWREVSGCTSGLLLQQQHRDNLIRLTCSATGMDDVHSNVIGPIIEDDDVKALLSRAIPLVKESDIRVMSYNILADAFMRTQVKPIVSFFPYCAAEYQKRTYREPRIVAQIHKHFPHIVGLQEVEDKTFRNTIVPMLSHYTGRVSVIRGRIKAGCALLYRTNFFEEIVCENFPLPDLYDPMLSTEPDIVMLGNILKEKVPEVMKDMKIRPIMTQIIILRNIHTNKHIVVGNTHLFWNPDYSIVTLLHLHALCTKISNMREKYMNNGKNVAVVLCGDFNSNTESLVHQYLVTGSLTKEDTSKWKVKGTDCSVIAEHVHNPLKLILARGSPNFTNYTEKFKDVIDYILCDTGTKVVQTTPSHREELLSKEVACPSAIFPSDHLPVITDFEMD